MLGGEFEDPGADVVERVGQLQVQFLQADHAYPAQAPVADLDTDIGQPQDAPPVVDNPLGCRLRGSAMLCGMQKWRYAQIFLAIDGKVWWISPAGRQHLSDSGDVVAHLDAAGLDGW